MEIIKVGICKDKEGFANALVRGLARESRAMVFQLISGEKESQDCQMILAMENSTDPRWVHLTEEREDHDQMETWPYQLFRYEDAQTMAKNLLLIYFSMTGKSMNHSGGRACKLLITMAECGGAGATSLSVSLGRTIYALYGYKCLYVNLCPINDGVKYLKSSQSPIMAKLLYYLDTGKTFPLEPFISSADEIDYINSDLINGYTHEISSQMVERLLLHVDELETYQYVIMDMGNHLSGENRKLLDNAQHILYLRHSKRKLAQWYQDKAFIQVTKNASEEKILIVNNFVDDEWESEDYCQICIENSEEAFSFDEENMMQIKLNHRYGINVAAIAKQIVEGES